MKAARIETSPRLQRVRDLLADGREYSTLDIVIGASVCAVNSCIAELRANGYAITCRRAGDIWFYRMETAHELA
jgi:biotin operon repressor